MITHVQRAWFGLLVCAVLLWVLGARAQVETHQTGTPGQGGWAELVRTLR